MLLRLFAGDTQCNASSASISMQAKNVADLLEVLQEYRCVLYFSATPQWRSQSHCSHMQPTTAANLCQCCPLSFDLLQTFHITVSSELAVTTHYVLHCGSLCYGALCCGMLHYVAYFLHVAGKWAFCLGPTVFEEACGNSCAPLGSMVMMMMVMMRDCSRDCQPFHFSVATLGKIANNSITKQHSLVPAAKGW